MKVLSVTHFFKNLDLSQRITCDFLMIIAKVIINKEYLKLLPVKYAEEIERG